MTIRFVRAWACENCNDSILGNCFLKTSVFILMALLLLIPEYAMGFTIGKVVDLFTNRPIGGALVRLNNDIGWTNENGQFYIKNPGDKVGIKAHGYLKTEKVITDPLSSSPQEIKLGPFNPKALYLSFYGIGDRTLRESALRLIEKTELNALVIDVKGDRGMIPYKSSILLPQKSEPKKSSL